MLLLNRIHIISGIAFPENDLAFIGGNHLCGGTVEFPEILHGHDVFLGSAGILFRQSAEFPVLLPFCHETFFFLSGFLLFPDEGLYFFIISRQGTDPVSQLPHQRQNLIRLLLEERIQALLINFHGIKPCFRNDGCAAGPGFNHGHFAEKLSGLHFGQFPLIRLAVMNIYSCNTFLNLIETVAHFSFTEYNFTLFNDNFAHFLLSFPFVFL